MAKFTAAKRSSIPITPACLTGSYMFFDVQHNNGTFEVANDQQGKLAVLDTETTCKLRALRHIQGVRFEAVVQDWIITKRKPSTTTPFPLSINILGPINVAEMVSRTLKETHGFLQHPHALQGQTQYDNPDMLVFPGQEPEMSKYVGITTSTGHWNRMRKEFENIFDSLSYVSDSEALSPLKGLKSALTQHQADAVRFILQREDAETTRSLSAGVSRAIVAGTAQDHGPSPTLGGLIADVMGLGKTLTTLCSILHTADRSQDFALFSVGGCAGEAMIDATKATLVVLPSVRE